MLFKMSVGITELFDLNGYKRLYPFKSLFVVIIFFTFTKSTAAVIAADECD
ncbi:hypothetical protein [Pedobacter nyackensis]|uniref:hypothetical protein n=1 Tax=Pedobacter nyackensis TaxID=475255 RepID=UPI0029311CA3|nr:hypothetical protein [Pedobacter nyackensis]